MSRRNNLLYFRDLKVGTLDVSDASPDALRRLLQTGSGEGGGVRLSELVAPERVTQAAAALREIAKRALSNYEERGLDTLFMAIGLATWTSEDGGRDTAAPVLLVPIGVSLTRGRSDLELLRKGDIQLNDVLAHALRELHGVALDAEAVLARVVGEDEDDDLDIQRAFDAVTATAARVPGFAIARRWVLGNFAFQKLAIVKDLQELGPSLAAHPIVAGIAGDTGAAQAARGSREGIDPRELDTRLPEQEFLIRDADSSQQRAIALVLRGQNGVISGPPGTGKSQTISNLIAELVAQGKTVLFVAEKRAALDVVLSRLADADLGHLCLDCHGAELSRRKIAEQLKESLSRVREAPRVDAADLHRRFVERRDRLNGHVRGLHDRRQPWGISLYELYGRLLALPTEALSPVRLPRQVVAAIGLQALERASERVRELASLADLFTGASTSAWTGAGLATPDDVRRAVERSRRLAHEAWPRWQSAAHALFEECGLAPPATVGKTRAVLSLLGSIDDTLNQCDTAIYQEDLSRLAEALAPAQSGLGAFWALITNGEYRAALRAVRAHAVDKKLPAAAAWRLVRQAQADLQAWRDLSGGQRVPPATRLRTLGAARKAWAAVVEDLQPLVSVFKERALDDLVMADLGPWLGRLAQDVTAPSQIVQVHGLVAEFKAMGLDPVLQQLASARPSPLLWPAVLTRAWLTSCLEEMQLQEPALAGFNGRRHDEIAEEFRQLDRQRLEVAVARVQLAHAERALLVRNGHAGQNTLVTREANKRSRHLPLRRLFEEAGDVLLALRPCWMASPLSVSQLIPGDRPRFDVVIFDEASQVLPEDAVTSLLRGGQAVIAGDQRQLPPTMFFAAGEPEDADDDADATAGFQSILDAMSAFLEPGWSLDWHYRSRDEALIAYSNHEIYDRRLITFPGPGGDGAVRHELVPHDPAAGTQQGSVGAEVRRVVELVRRHAVERPEASLGVITMGIEHARRIEMALDRARALDPVLELLFADGARERFFVKNLERVQGDERDVIILSIGYGKNEAGQMVYRFGPLLQEGGERRLNVAITRARDQMIVVSSFTHHDLAPDYPKRGVQLLRGFLEFAASGGRHFARGTATTVPLNPFEQSVFDELTRHGLKLVPQVGSSNYRIDMVAMHPEQEGRFVLAIECDGASYHSAPTARDRDRLRQQQLEARGWRFHRIWSTDWFLRRDEEVQRTLRAFEEAVRYGSVVTTPPAAVGPGPVSPPRSRPEPLAEAPVVSGPPSPASGGRTRGPRPNVLAGRGGIADYSMSELRELVRWVRSDGLMHTDEEIVAEVTAALGFKRRGAKIVSAIEAAIRAERS